MKWQEYAIAFLLAMLLVLAVDLLMAVPVMLTWNEFAPAAFGGGEISYWQALTMSVFSSIVFKSSGISSSKKNS